MAEQTWPMNNNPRQVDLSWVTIPKNYSIFQNCSKLSYTAQSLYDIFLKSLFSVVPTSMSLKWQFEEIDIVVNIV